METTLPAEQVLEYKPAPVPKLLSLPLPEMTLCAPKKKPNLEYHPEKPALDASPSKKVFGDSLGTASAPKYVPSPMTRTNGASGDWQTEGDEQMTIEIDEGSEVNADNADSADLEQPIVSDEVTKIGEEKKSSSGSNRSESRKHEHKSSKTRDRPNEEEKEHRSSSHKHKERVEHRSEHRSDKHKSSSSTSSSSSSSHRKSSSGDKHRSDKDSSKTHRSSTTASSSSSKSRHHSSSSSSKSTSHISGSSKTSSSLSSSSSGSRSKDKSESVPERTTAGSQKTVEPAEDFELDYEMDVATSEAEIVRQCEMIFDELEHEFAQMHKSAEKVDNPESVRKRKAPSPDIDAYTEAATAALQKRRVAHENADKFKPQAPTAVHKPNHIRNAMQAIFDRRAELRRQEKLRADANAEQLRLAQERVRIAQEELREAKAKTLTPLISRTALTPPTRTGRYTTPFHLFLHNILFILCLLQLELLRRSRM